MVKVIYVQHDGIRHEIDAKPGLSAMEAAVKNNVPGIDGDCGGACACATCHVYVDADWQAATGTAGELETSMLEFAENVEANSRLACQITVGAALDGLVLHMPASQH